MNLFQYSSIHDINRFYLLGFNGSSCLQLTGVLSGQRILIPLLSVPHHLPPRVSGLYFTILPLSISTYTNMTYLLKDDASRVTPLIDNASRIQSLGDRLVDPICIKVSLVNDAVFDSSRFTDKTSHDDIDRDSTKHMSDIAILLTFRRGFTFRSSSDNPNSSKSVCLTV